jgi:hypothetical protein
MRRDPLYRSPLTHADVERRNNLRFGTSLVVLAMVGAVSLYASYWVSTGWLVTIIVVQSAIAVGLLWWMLTGGAEDRARAYRGPWRT